MSEYNLQAIRELLGEAFSSGEITTLAFDLFHDVYQDFTAGMTRAQKIEMIVNKANSKGRIPDLIAYVQRHNLYQYSQFADQLNAPTALAEKSVSFSSKRLQREKEDLESQWKLASEKVRRLNEANLIETDITRKFQIERQLEQAKKELSEIEDSLEALDS